MSNELCKHMSSAPRELLRGLPESQGGLGRHRCSACAFNMGISELNKRIDFHGRFVKCSHGKVAPESILKSLKESQGGTGRHKCVVCAYQIGRAKARSVPNKDAWKPKPKSYTGSLTLIENIEVPPDNVRGLVSSTQSDWWKRDLEYLKKIGDLGEELVLEYEKSLLLSIGRMDLAHKVRHVSKLDGDAEGYDIRSYSEKGEAKFIEVKTTTLSARADFYLSANEYVFSKNNSKNYYLYRLFDLDIENIKANFFIKNGLLDSFFLLKPTEYKVNLK